MTYAGYADRDAIESEAAWSERGLPVTIWQQLCHTAGRFPHRPAMSYQMFSGPRDRAETLSWSELQGRTAQLANLLRELGVGETDKVAYLLPNCTEALVSYLGGMVAGIVCPINPLLNAEQIGSILRQTEARVLITLRAFPRTDVAQKAAEAVSLAPGVAHVLEVDLHRYLTGVKRLVVPFLRPKIEARHEARVQDFWTAIKPQPDTLAFDDIAHDRVCANFHTGGTTGMPKVAQLRASGVIYNGWIGDRLLFSETDNIMCPLPLFHVFANIVIVGASLRSGAHAVFPTPQGYRGEGVMDNFWKLCERYRITFMITVPTAMSALMQRKVDADISSLKIAFCGSAPLPVELYRRFEESAGVTICEGYGLTEATCLVSINPPDGEKKVGSIGIPFPHTEVRIMRTGPTGPEDCPADVVGEICVASPGVWPGNTYTEPGKNRDMYYDERFLRTGDLGRRDRDGYIWITGRAKDLIIRGGHNIDPAAIEEALAGHEAVAMVGAIGQPDIHSGELPCAYVELCAGCTVTPDELVVFARERVHERAAWPKHIEILDELPKTAVGKVFKPDLRRRAITRVFDRTLAEKGLAAEVAEVREDPRRGLIARIRRTGPVDAGAVTRALAGFAQGWEWSDRG